MKFYLNNNHFEKRYEGGKLSSLITVTVMMTGRILACRAPNLKT